MAFTQEIKGDFYSVFNSFFNYLKLKDTNDDLIKKLSKTETELFWYKNILKLENNHTYTTYLPVDSSLIIYRFIPACVVNNSIYNFANYIILNKGIENNIQKDMGVLSVDGVVGIVVNASTHFSKIITLLNPNLKLSCKLKRTNFFGYLIWDGKDPQYTYLTELPSGSICNRGDTVVTSGCSVVFPEGVPVGVVQSQKAMFSDFNSVKVKFFTKFNSLHEVLIVKNFVQKERNALMQ